MKIFSESKAFSFSIINNKYFSTKNNNINDTNNQNSLENGIEVITNEKKYSNFLDFEILKNFSIDKTEILNNIPNKINLEKNFSENVELTKNKLNKIFTQENFNKIINPQEIKHYDFDTDYSALFSTFESFEQFDFFFEKNKSSLQTNIENLLLFFDYLVEFSLKLKNFNQKNNFFCIIEKIIFLIDDKLLSLDPFLIISFIESLYKSKFYVQNKIWIKIEYILLRTNIIRNISLDFYFIILKAYEYYFLREDSTILADEIFELIEYNCLLKLKDPEEKIFEKIKKNLQNFQNNFIFSLQKFTEKNMFSPIILLPLRNRFSFGLNENIYNQNIFLVKNVNNFCIYEEIKIFEENFLKSFFNSCELYYVFSKNLEGSKDFYKNFLEKIFDFENLKIFENIFVGVIITHENTKDNIGLCEIKILNQKLFECLVNLYFSSILVYDNVCNKIFISEFIEKLERFILNIFDNFEKNLKSLLEKNILISVKKEKANLIMRIPEGEYLVKNCVFNENSKIFVFFEIEETEEYDIFTEETRSLLLWCFAKRNILNTNPYLKNIFSA